MSGCLSPCILVDSSTVMLDESLCHFRGGGGWGGESGLFYHSYFIFFRKTLLANNVDPDHTSQVMASDLGLHCLPLTFLQVSRW